MSEDLSAKLDDLFERIVFNRPSAWNRCGAKRQIVNPLDFDEIDVMTCISPRLDNGRIFLLSSAVYNNDDELQWAFFDPSVIWPFKAQIVTSSQPRSGWKPGTLNLSSVESCSQQTARGWGATMFARHMVLIRHAFIEPNGDVSSACCPMVHLGRRWIDARRRLEYIRVPGKPDHEEGYVPRPGPYYANPTHDPYYNETHNPVAMAQSAAFTQRYEWSVCVGLGSGPKLRLASDPTGLRAMFRDREKEDGRERRAALRHWVQAHWRQKRNDPYDLAWVRAYLRGRTAFRWYGYDCVIRPSSFDLEQLARAS